MKLPRNQKIITLIVITAVPLVGTASAYGAATTAITMTVTSSIAAVPGLTISAPGTVSLGTSVAFPATFTIVFPGQVAVTDTRGSSTNWDSSVLISALTPVSGGPTIPASIFSYNPGVVVPTGTGTLSGYVASSPATPITVVTARDVTTNVSATWIPTLTINEPYAPATGSYTGTITSSVF